MSRHQILNAGSSDLRSKDGVIMACYLAASLVALGLLYETSSGRDANSPGAEMAVAVSQIPAY